MNTKYYQCLSSTPLNRPDVSMAIVWPNSNHTNKKKASASAIQKEVEKKACLIVTFFDFLLSNPRSKIKAEQDHPKIDTLLLKGSCGKDRVR